MKVFFANSYQILESDDGVTMVFGFTLPNEKPCIQSVVMSFAGFKTLTNECVDAMKKIEKEHGEIKEWKRVDFESTSSIAI